MKKIFSLFIFHIVTVCFTIACYSSKNDNCNLGNVFWQKSRSAYKKFNDAISPITHTVWNTPHHTSGIVLVGSIGPLEYQSDLKGIIKNTDVAQTISKAILNGVSIILVVGDGFGVSHFSMQHYMDIATQRKGKNPFDFIFKHGQVGLCYTYAHSALVTDSAAAATALACGVKTDVGKIGIKPDGSVVESVLIKAQRKGYKTGIVTDTSVTDATPAGFYGHVQSRDEGNLLAEQLAVSKIDVILGGGAAHFIPKDTIASNHPYLKKIAIDGTAKRTDNLDLVKMMKAKGYTVVANKTMLFNNYKNAQKLLGLFSATSMNSRIDRDDENTGEPSIPEMVKAAFFLLSKNNGRFFIMIECGKMDEDSHDNDLGAVIAAIREIEEVLALCLQYYRKNPAKTLLIFTADHETGSPAFSYFEVGKNEHILKLKKATAFSFPTTDGIKYFLKQKQSLRKIFREAKSSHDLWQKLNNNFPFGVSKEIVESIYADIAR